MVKKTISQQTDGTQLRDPRLAQSIYEQNGDTFFDSLSEKRFHVKSEAHLLSLFPSLEIPDGEKITIVIDNSFALTQGFKLGLGSVLEILRGSVEVTLDTTALTGPLFSLTNPANDCRALIVDGVFFVGDDTQPFCILKGTSRVFMEDVRAQGYLGADVEFPFYKLVDFAPVDWGQGWVIRNPFIVQIFQSNIRQFSDKNITLFSFILNNPAFIAINADAESTLFAGETLFYFDPNAAAGTNIAIVETAISAGDFYQVDETHTISAVADNGSGKLRCTAAFHGIPNGRVVRLENFSESTYNITEKTTFVDANTFDVEKIDFVPGVDSGDAFEDSLDQTSPLINAIANPGQQDSMSLAEGRSMNPISFLSVIGVFQPLQNVPPVAGDFVEDTATESFTVDDETGLITYIGLEPITATIAFDFLLSKVGGGSDDVVVSLFDLTTQLSKTDRIATITSTAQSIDYNGGIFQIAPGDNFQLKLDSNSVSTINVSALKILITRQ